VVVFIGSGLPAAAVKARTWWSVRQPAALTGVREAARDNRTVIAGAVYEFDAGRVRVLSR
jgi:hypothetical protein